MNSKLRQRIGDTIAEMPVFNHHEHCWKSFSTDHQQEFDLPCLMSWGYLGGNLDAAGLREPRDFAYLSDPSLPDGSEKAWSLISAFLPKVRNAAFYRYLLPTLRDLFQVEESDLYCDRWREASARIRAYSRETKGKGAELSTRMGTTCSVLDAKAGIAPGLPNTVPSDHTLLNVIRLDRFISEGRGLKMALDDHPNRDFDGWMELFDGLFKQALDDGAHGFKCGLAYNRPLDFGCPPRDDAARIFNSGVLTATSNEKKTFQDYMMNRLAGLCVEADVPMQIHAGMTGDIAGANPTHMTEFLYKHEELRLDLFHGGYPWSVQAGLMAANHQNLFIDGCWLHTISYQGFREALTAWIENVPMNKIFAWGGDHIILEQSYGSLLVARELVAEVLADLVEREYFDEELALEVARCILHDNGIEFWKLEKQ